jgi:hypothetical protein
MKLLMAKAFKNVLSEVVTIAKLPGMQKVKYRCVKINVKTKVDCLSLEVTVSSQRHALHSWPQLFWPT